MQKDLSDTPYDYDHILPKSHLITSGASPNTGLKGGDEKKFFYTTDGCISTR